MPLDFPDSPSTNDTYSAGGRSWTYNGTSWVLDVYVGVVPAGAVGTTELAANGVTYAKLGPTGATDGQALLANSAAPTGLEWGQAGYAPDDVQTVLSAQIFGNG
jgi:hypothetical protein